MDTGRYKSASKVIDEALRLIDARDRFEHLQRDLGTQIAMGVASLRAGRTVDGESVFDRLDAALAIQEKSGS